MEMRSLYRQRDLLGNPIDHYASLNAGYSVCLNTVYGKVILVPNGRHLDIQVGLLEARNIMLNAMASGI